MLRVHPHTGQPLCSGAGNFEHPGPNAWSVGPHAPRFKPPVTTPAAPVNMAPAPPRPANTPAPARDAKQAATLDPSMLLYNRGGLWTGCIW